MSVQALADESIYFLGYEQNQWVLFYRPLEASDYKKISFDDEPRELYYIPSEQRALYINSKAQLVEKPLPGEERVLLTPKGSDSYAQPVYDLNTQSVFMVYMPSGESSKADIVRYQNGKLMPFIRQASSQFEPYVAEGWLYYGNVHCVIDCGKIIQEVWRKHIIGGQAEQITLQHHIARQPVLNTDQQQLLFISNRNGPYQVWSQDLGTLEASQLTESSSQESDVAVDQQGNIYFLSYQAGQPTLQVLSHQTLSSLPLPKSVTLIRNVRVNP
jgi:hypothetical protein